ITTGLIRIRLRHFLFGATPAAFLWATTPLLLGYLLRGQIAGLQRQYVAMTHDIVIGSVMMTVLVAIIWWLRRVSSHRLRRIRAIAGLAVVFGICARLELAVLNSNVWHVQLPIPAAPTLGSWAGIMAVLAAAIAWMAMHDLRMTRSHPAIPRHIGALNAVIWIGLFALVTGFGSLVGVHHLTA
ncbi:MAG TPA: hypothetical protein VF221_11685, partial [Chloroflexota bacterium]